MNTQAATALILALATTTLPLMACEVHSPTQALKTAKVKFMPESAKRQIPGVEPSESKGIRYEVIKAARSRGFAQHGGVIAAIEVKSGKELWTLQVYTVSFDAQEEQDVQERYITSMSMSPDGQSVQVLAEGQRRYAARLSDQAITPLP